jgi:hypothetical protein
MKKFILLIPFALLFYSATAQKKAPVIKPYTADEAKEARKEADLAFKSLSYGYARTFYERLVVTEPNNVEYNHRLGLCYLNTNVNKGKAVSYLEYVANSNAKDKPKDILFDLGKAYHYAGLYDQALETYEKFRESKGGTVDPKLRFDLWVEWSENANKLTETPVRASWSNPGKTINSAQSDYRPLRGAADTVVYFSSRRKGTMGGEMDDFGELPTDIFFFTQNDTSRGKAKNAGINLNTEFYEETMFLSMAGDRLLVYKEGPESNGDIYISDLQGKSWSRPVLVSKDFLTKVLETGASMSPDGMTLYFSAEEPGSKTGKDIYRCTRTPATAWSKPEKLAGSINTKWDEDMPMMWMDGKTLFFSSAGHGSMGGLDIYKSVMNDPKEGFSKPVNIGYPLNSVYDDLSLALSCDGKSAWVSAVRDSGIGDYDLWEVKLEQSLIEKPMVWLSGKGITNVGTPAKGAFVVITEKSTGNKVFEIEANEATGRFDAALYPGEYKVVLRHPKAGKTEADVTIAAGESRSVVELVFP